MAVVGEPTGTLGRWLNSGGSGLSGSTTRLAGFSSGRDAVAASCDEDDEPFVRQMPETSG